MEYQLAVQSETVGSLEQFQGSSNMDPRYGIWKADFEFCSAAWTLPKLWMPKHHCMLIFLLQGSPGAFCANAKHLGILSQDWVICNYV